MKFRSILTLLPFFTINLFGQAGVGNLFRSVEIRMDTATFSSYQHVVNYQEEQALYFIYNREDETAEVTFYPLSSSVYRNVSLLPSGDFDIVDSLQFFDDAWHCKLRFRNLTLSQYLKLQVRVNTGTDDRLGVVRLLPCTITKVSMNPGNDELFIGEEKIFDLVTNNLDNLRFSTEWTSGLPIDYRIERAENQLRLHVMPNELGIHKVRPAFHTEKPFVDMFSNEIVPQPAALEFVFDVKTSRLRFLNIDRREITLEDESRRQGTEVQLDNARLLELNRTYRIEDQENPGGALIAELFTRSYLSTNKVLCIFRAYDYHRSTEGYLYIQDRDEALFITNLNITPATSISKVSIMRPG